MANLDTFKKDQFNEGFCNQCKRVRSKVSEQLQICKECLANLQYEPQEPQYHPDPAVARTNYRCKKCNLAKTNS